MAMGIAVQGFGKSFSNNTVLKDISFNIVKGSGLLENGCSKTAARKWLLENGMIDENGTTDHFDKPLTQSFQACLKH